MDVAQARAEESMRLTERHVTRYVEVRTCVFSLIQRGMDVSFDVQNVPPPSEISRLINVPMVSIVVIICHALDTG